MFVKLNTVQIQQQILLTDPLFNKSFGFKKQLCMNMGTLRVFNWCDMIWFNKIMNIFIMIMLSFVVHFFIYYFQAKFTYLTFIAQMQNMCVAVSYNPTKYILHTCFCSILKESIFLNHKSFSHEKHTKCVTTLSLDKN